MTKIKQKFRNIILLFLMLVVWVVVGLLGKVVSNKSSAPFIKESQAACCPCAPIGGGGGGGGGCDGCAGDAVGCSSCCGATADAACSDTGDPCAA